MRHEPIKLTGNQNSLGSNKRNMALLCVLNGNDLGYVLVTRVTLTYGVKAPKYFAASAIFVPRWYFFHRSWC